jgi:hypothetical protein
MSELQASLGQLEKSSLATAADALNASLATLSETLFAEQKANFGLELGVIYKGLTQHTQTELNIYLDSLQAQSQLQLQQKLGDTFPALYENLSNELSATLRADFTALAEAAKKDYIQGLSVALPVVEQALENKTLEILNAELPRIEQLLTASVKSEIEQLVESVRLVFSK